MDKVGMENFEKFAAKAKLPVRLVQDLVQESVDKILLDLDRKPGHHNVSGVCRDAISAHIQGLVLFKAKRQT